MIYILLLIYDYNQSNYLCKPLFLIINKYKLFIF